MICIGLGINTKGCVRSHSQEHGAVKFDERSFYQIKVRDQLPIIPAHSYLVLEAL